jgi:HK97 family phage portal protein
MLLDSLFKNNYSGRLQTAKFLDNTYPLFSQFGRNIYASDVVQTCIDRIATELSKLRPKHVRRDPSGKLLPVANDHINALFRSGPNEIMTTRDFIEKIIWRLYLDYNAFIYPAYDLVTDAKGRTSRRYTGFYPLAPTGVDFLQDATGTYYVRFHFASGDKYTLPYSDIIHLRKKFSINDVMGGGANGQPDNAALLKTLEINDTILTGVGKAVKTSMQIRGIIKIAGALEGEKQELERKALEKQIAEDAYGIVSGDYTSDFQPITIDPKVIDTTTLDFVQNKILRWYGVSLPVLNGTATDDENQAWYNGALEHIIIGMNQGFTKVLFSKDEQSHGNEIIFYNFALETMSVKNKTEISKILGDRGALTNNFLLQMFGIEPYEGGDIRAASLNYINTNIWDAYQLARAGIDSQAPGTNKNGGE